MAAVIQLTPAQRTLWLTFAAAKTKLANDTALAATAASLVTTRQTAANAATASLTSAQQAATAANLVVTNDNTALNNAMNAFVTSMASEIV